MATSFSGELVRRRFERLSRSDEADGVRSLPSHAWCSVWVDVQQTRTSWGSGCWDLLLVSRPAGRRLRPPSGPGSLDGTRRVLVVEDELKLAALIRKALNEQGMSADLASSGEDALQMAMAGSYDLLLLDINLPGLDGFEVCRRLRAQGISTPILMLTAGDLIDERGVDIDERPDDCMAKPFDFEELFARVRRLTTLEPE